MVCINYALIASFIIRPTIIYSKDPSPIRKQIGLSKTFSEERSTMHDPDHSNMIRNLDMTSSVPIECSGQVISIEISTDAFPREITWNVTDGYRNNETVLSGGPYFRGNTKFVHKQCLNAGNYTFIIFDREGDGLCCWYGEGGYKVSIEGDTIRKGGEFKQREATDFIIHGIRPSAAPSRKPSILEPLEPSLESLTVSPFNSTSAELSSSPTNSPSAALSLPPSNSPSFKLSALPSYYPSFELSSSPSNSPSTDLSAPPSNSTSSKLSSSPSNLPSGELSVRPSDLPSSISSSSPSNSPSTDLSAPPSNSPSSKLSSSPSNSPSTDLSAPPSNLPSLD